jgi:hypothetical protein
MQVLCQPHVHVLREKLPHIFDFNFLSESCGRSNNESILYHLIGSRVEEAPDVKISCHSIDAALPRSWFVDAIHPVRI